MKLLPPPTNQPPTVKLPAVIIGEKPNPLVAPFKDDTGAPVSLAGFAAAIQWRRTGAVAPVEKAAAITTVDAAADAIRYDWDDTDLAVAGTYRIVMWAGNGTLRYATNVYELQVQDPQVGAAPPAI